MGLLMDRLIFPSSFIRLTLVCESACSVNDDDIIPFLARSVASIATAAGSVFIPLLKNPAPVRSAQICNWSTAAPECIACPQKYFMASLDILVSQFANGRGFTYTIDTDDHNDVGLRIGRMIKCRKVSGIVSCQ